MSRQFFEGRQLAIASMHGKEEALQSMLEKRLGVRVAIPTGFDSDEFGTFSGEVERTSGPYATARNKAKSVHALTGCSLVLATEGSFGPHPVMGFIPAQEEWIVLMDFEKGLEYHVRHISTATNFGAAACQNWQELEDFARLSRFPSHGLILRPSKADYSEIHKGLRQWDDLRNSFNYFEEMGEGVYAETDMRAHMNPSRMLVIGEAGAKLLQIIETPCPMCQTPGFAVDEQIPGLPCEICSKPTRATLAVVRKCQQCGYRKEELYPNQRTAEDPMYCDTCNP